MKIKTTMSMLLLVIGGIFSAGTASAAMSGYPEGVAYQNVKFISGIGGFDEDFVLGASDLGTYQVSLFDYVFPEAFEAMGLLLTWGTDDLVRFDGPGVYSFNVRNPGQYFVSIWGDTGNTLNLGLFGVKIELLEKATPVPLPASVVLLGSALMVLMWFKQSRRQEQSLPAVVFA